MGTGGVQIRSHPDLPRAKSEQNLFGQPNRPPPYFRGFWKYVVGLGRVEGGAAGMAVTPRYRGFVQSVDTLKYTHHALRCDPVRLTGMGGGGQEDKIVNSKTGK